MPVRRAHLGEWHRVLALVLSVGVQGGRFPEALKPLTNLSASARSAPGRKRDRRALLTLPLQPLQEAASGSACRRSVCSRDSDCTRLLLTRDVGHLVTGASR